MKNKEICSQSITLHVTCLYIMVTDSLMQLKNNHNLALRLCNPKNFK